MKVKCKFNVITYGKRVDDVLLKYKFENDWFYKWTYVKRSDIWNVPEEYTEAYEVYVNLSEEHIVKEIAKMTTEEVKNLCQRIIKRSISPVKKQESNALYDAINKINNMNFEIELD